MINVKQLNFTYPKSAHPAVVDMSFEIQRGEIFGFLGPSGAGKSTTQKILIGLLEGFHGSVEVMGKPVNTWGSDFYEQIGVGFEMPNHFQKLTALENLKYFSALYQRPAHNPMQLLEKVGLADDANVYVGQYSKGMKTRLTFARALLHNPPLLFLDEPTTGLDPVNARNIKDLIFEEKRAGKTIFLTTHNMAVADELCDRVAFIVDGSIRQIGAPQALKIANGQRSVHVSFTEEGCIRQQVFPFDGLADDAAFLALLRSNSLQTIHSQEASLEEIFIKVTGRGLA